MVAIQSANFIHLGRIHHVDKQCILVEHLMLITQRKQNLFFSKQN